MTKEHLKKKNICERGSKNGSRSDNRKPNNNNVHYPYYRRILLFKRDNHKGRYKTVVLIRTEYNQSVARHAKSEKRKNAE